MDIDIIVNIAGNVHHFHNAHYEFKYMDHLVECWGAFIIRFQRNEIIERHTWRTVNHDKGVPVVSSPVERLIYRKAISSTKVLVDSKRVGWRSLWNSLQQNLFRICNVAALKKKGF